MSKIKIKTREAFGYYSQKENDIFLEFIKKSVGNKKIIIKGLIIPKEALLSIFSKNKRKINFKKGSKVSIFWKDIVYIANMAKRKYSVMNSVGIVFKDNPKYVFLKNPITHKIYPKIKMKHPEKTPTFYVIPKCLILEKKI